MNLDQQRVALITGAGQGIGRAIALQLAQDGCRIVVNDLEANQSAAEETVARIAAQGGAATVAYADVGDRHAMESLFDSILHDHGRIDVAVANAVFQVKKPIVDLDWETIQRIMNVTMFGQLHVAQLAARQMIEQFKADSSKIGRIVLIGSVHAEMAIPHHGVYAMAKVAGNKLCQTLAAEVAKYQIHVNAINPGWIDTEGERLYLSEQDIRKAETKLPLQRLGQPEEIANMVSYLCSEAANYITGSIFAVDGAIRLHQEVIMHALE